MSISIRRVLTSLLLAGLSCAHAEPPRPNVVLILADDMSWHDVRAFGGPTDALTPNLDRLAGEGVKLTGLFASSSVCAPIRQALLTGMYPVRNGAYPNHGIVRPDVRTLPHHLGELGYRTASVGKTHYGPQNRFPFDARIPPVALPDDPATHGHATNGSIDFPAIQKFLDQAGEQPFCLYIAPNEPHSPWTKGDKSLFPPHKLTLPPYLVDTPETRRALSEYYAEVAYLDDEVGRLLQLLEENGKTQNTLVVFMSEHGSIMPQGKWTLYDVGIRAAVIARWPTRIQPGTENPALLQYVDLLPTVLAAAGADPTKSDTGQPDTSGYRGFDGRDALAVLTGHRTTHRDYVFAQNTSRGTLKGPEAYASRAVRDTEWKLIHNLHHDQTYTNVVNDSPLLRSWRRKGEQGDAFAAAQARRYNHRPEFELYHLQSDPWELNNIAHRPENAATLKRLRDELARWMEQQGDLGDQTERDAHKHQAGGGA